MNASLSLSKKTETDALIKCYYLKMTEGEEYDQLIAAREWDIWETSISQLLPLPTPEDEYVNFRNVLSHWTH